ncbi:MAG TPA: hypothetical protein P5137_14460, partial [Candidatus Brocadiia bacterium]|nr:hypothetical protein [Candidatus Brocadiia bacterium]
DYSGYLPCKPAYGRAAATFKLAGVKADLGLFTDGATGDILETNQTTAAKIRTFSNDGGPMDLMCIAFGANTDLTRRNANSAQWRQTAPFGLGCLAAGGYVADLRVFYCASWGISPGEIVRSGGEMGYYPGGGTTYDQIPVCYGIAATPRSLQLLGGTSPKSLSHGNYTLMAASQAKGLPTEARKKSYLEPGEYSTGNVNYGAMSSYAYRGQAVMGAFDWQTTALTDATTRFPAHYSRPLVTTELGAPLFKTQKLLGGRSIAADTFLRSHQDGLAMRPGYGVYHHREGYSVLYGDGRAAWFADPQRQIMWTGAAPRTNGASISSIFTSPGNWEAQKCGANFASVVVDKTLTASATSFTNGPSHVFHQFDLASGIDEGANPLP